MADRRAGMAKANSNALITILGKALVIILAMAKTLAEMLIKTKAKIVVKIAHQLDRHKALLANRCRKPLAIKLCHKRLCLRQNHSRATQTIIQIIEMRMVAMPTVATQIPTLAAHIEAAVGADNLISTAVIPA